MQLITRLAACQRLWHIMCLGLQLFVKGDIGILAWCRNLCDVFPQEKGLELLKIQPEVPASSVATLLSNAVAWPFPWLLGDHLFQRPLFGEDDDPCVACWWSLQSIKCNRIISSRIGFEHHSLVLPGGWTSRAFYVGLLNIPRKKTWLTHYLPLSCMFRLYATWSSSGPIVCLGVFRRAVFLLLHSFPVLMPSPMFCAFVFQVFLWHCPVSQLLFRISWLQVYSVDSKKRQRPHLKMHFNTMDATSLPAVKAKKSATKAIVAIKQAEETTFDQSKLYYRRNFWKKERGTWRVEMCFSELSLFCVCCFFLVRFCFVKHRVFAVF